LLAPITLDRDALKAAASFGEAMRRNAKDGVKALVIEKDDFSKQRVLEIPAFMVFHFGHAWEANTVIHVDFVKSDKLDLMSDYRRRLMRGESTPAGRSHAAFPKIDLNRGRCETQTRNESVEFPRVDPRFCRETKPVYVLSDAGRWRCHCAFQRRNAR
jgi:carotenoid cleavage dioxygenase